MIRREVIQPAPPKPTSRLVFEGGDARELIELLASNVTIPHALRTVGEPGLADQFYLFTRRFFDTAPQEVAR